MLTEGQKIKIEEGDAPEFIEMVNKIMEAMIFKYNVGEVAFVKIKNWFDHKWLNYSGKTVVLFDFHGLKGFYDSALENVWRDKITIPPFNPNRVIYSKFFRKKETGNRKIEKKIHQWRISTDNVHNRVVNYTTDGLLVWFSSNTAINQKGSLMVYRSQKDQVHTWYASLENIGEWRITKSKGVKLDELTICL